jgi:hypothetical protein
VVLLAAIMLAGGLLAPAPASATLGPHVAPAITPPQHDPFYKPPAGYASTAPGTILRSRPVDLAVLGFLPQNVQAWQLLYRTTSYQGKPMATVTTVVRPSGPAPKAVVSYQVAEDASAPQCAPSYALRRAFSERVRVRPTLVVSTVSGRHLILAICSSARAGGPPAVRGRAPRSRPALRAHVVSTRANRQDPVTTFHLPGGKTGPVTKARTAV